MFCCFCTNLYLKKDISDHIFSWNLFWCKFNDGFEHTCTLKYFCLKVLYYFNTVNTITFFTDQYFTIKSTLTEPFHCSLLTVMHEPREFKILLVSFKLGLKAFCEIWLILGFNMYCIFFILYSVLMPTSITGLTPVNRSSWRSTLVEWTKSTPRTTKSYVLTTTEILKDLQR